MLFICIQGTGHVPDNNILPGVKIMKIKWHLNLGKNYCKYYLTNKTTFHEIYTQNK